MNTVSPSPAIADRPLAISLLLGVSGWVAGVFVLLFVALLFQPHGAGQAAITGAVLLAAAWGLLVAERDGQSIFVAQIGIALSIAGQCLAVYAMSDEARGVAGVAHAALLLQVVLALVMPSRLHRTLSTLFATIAWALTLHFALLGEQGGWSPLDDLRPASLPVALADWLLAWGPVAAALWWSIRHEAAWATRAWAPVVPPIRSGLVVGLAVATLASHPFESFRWIDGHAAADSAALWPLLSAFGALGALAAGFALRRGGLMALCATAALLHVVQFYFALGATLLVKSLLMLALGAVFVVAARALQAKDTA